MRIPEAMVNHLKLITNNKMITKYKFYSPDNCILFLYGDIPTSDQLDFIDEKLPMLDGIETYLSPVFENGKEWFSAVEKFVKSHKNIRLQLQLHKILGIE